MTLRMDDARLSLAVQAGKHHGGGSVLVAAHSELISFSTRSSMALNGSLQSTVRWA